MRRIYALALLAGTAALVALCGRLGTSKEGPAPAGPEAAPARALPITHVSLFTSGVGHFLRQGEVTGNARIDLSFPAGDINDLLKSMVLDDPAGRAKAIGYDSPDPVEKTLDGFAIKLAGDPSFADILRQARGEKVEVTLQRPASAAITGSILGVERKGREREDKEAPAVTAPEVELLNLWCSDGMRTLKLSEVQRVRFLNPALDDEVKRALEVLVRSHDARKKSVRLTFAGKDRRRVRVGYVIETPLWKTSYRLVLDGRGGPALQGWALVENTTDHDWQDVRLALIAGRPVSFRMDLYQPLFVPRPVVEPELFASLRPATYRGPLLTETDLGLSDAPGPGGGSQKTKSMESDKDKGGRHSGKDRDKGAKEEPHHEPGRPTPPPAPPVQAGALGDFFQYLLEEGVQLPRQQSALFPIIQKLIEATRVSIYTEATLNRHPMLGLRLKNSTGLHLNQGPWTIYEGTSYAGDAHVLDLQPHEERLISYAVDLGTEVEPRAPEPAQRLESIRVVRGVLVATVKQREAKVYRVKNRSTQDRLVLIEHPFRAEYALVSAAKPAERARDVYRFEVKVPAGKVAELEVAEERPVRQEVRLSGADDDTWLVYLKSPAASAKVKEALQKALALKQMVLQTGRQREAKEGELKDMVADQARIRANMERLPQTSEAYKRYLKKIDEQETQIEKLQEEIRKVRLLQERQRKEYEDYLAGLSVE